MHATRFNFVIKIPLLIGCLVLINQIGSSPLNAENSGNAADLYREAFDNLNGLSPADATLLNSISFNESGALTGSNQTEHNKLLLQLKPTLELVDKASKLEHANWETDDESAQWIELGSSSKKLMRALMLQARLHIDETRFEEASNVMLSAMVLSRHIGQDGVFIVRLIEASTFKMIAKFYTQELPKFPKPVLKSIQERVGELTVITTAQETLVAESQYSMKLSKQNGNPYPKDLMSGYLKFYDQVLEIGNLPPHQFEDKLKALGDSYSDNVMVKAILPMLPPMKQQIAVHEVNVELLELGLNVLLNGGQAVKDSKDPFGEGSFEYIQLGGASFELCSQMRYRGEKVKLRFGH